MKKLTVVLVFILALVVSIFGFKYFSKMTSEASTTASPQVMVDAMTVYQQIDPTGKAAENFHTITLQKNRTALDLLSKTHQIKTNGEGKNAFVNVIDNTAADTTKHEFWAFYVNGKQAQAGAGSYTLKPNDKILWKIETY
jgi:predicted negative regulator of RcsB-dependent stress response